MFAISLYSWKSFVQIPVWNLESVGALPFDSEVIMILFHKLYDSERTEYKNCRWDKARDQYMTVDSYTIIYIYIYSMHDILWTTDALLDDSNTNI